MAASAAASAASAAAPGADLDVEPAGAGAGGEMGSTLREPVPPRVVLPGDRVVIGEEPALAGVACVRAGDGLRANAEGTELEVTKPGLLCMREGGRAWVETDPRRYIPAVGDTVVGTVVERGSEHYRVNFGGPALGNLPALAFDGASRRNKPDLPIGALVYARVAALDPHLDPELACTVLSGPRRDWVSGESIFGELRDGMVVSVGIAFARRLASPSSPILSALGERLSFELAVGANGRVWVSAARPDDVILVANALRNAEFLTPPQQRAMVRRILAESQALDE